MSDQSITLEQVGYRAITPEDYNLLRSIYDSTRADEIKLVPHWTPEAVEAFLAQQFNAQHVFYQQAFKDADYMIVTLDGQDAGRLYLDRRKSEFRVIDMSILPQFRNRGLGTFLFKRVIAEANEAGKPVSIHVEENNPARNLYHRLGFTEKEVVNGVYLLMERAPDR